MTARILIVDDIEANRKVLGARLAAEYFEIETAADGREAIEICGRGAVDIVLLDVMMPGLNGFDTCRILKADANTHHIPVVMVTALDQISDRVEGLAAGADDFLTKPVDDIALVTRVKNLARLKQVTDELVMRLNTSRQLGLTDLDEHIEPDKLQAGSGRVLLVEDHQRTARRIFDALAGEYHLDVLTAAQHSLHYAVQGRYDLVIVSLDLRQVDGLRVVSQLRGHEQLRHMPVLTLTESQERTRLMRALEMGVNDYVVRPVDRNELLARVKTQIRRRRYADYLEKGLNDSVDQAVKDTLTGLHNRRYFESHFRTHQTEALRDGVPLSLLMADIDHFKSVNDTYGHDVGDLVLQEFARRMQEFVRKSDLACRLGGEEFVILMPGTSLEQAFFLAERLRKQFASAPFDLGAAGQKEEGQTLKITASIGVSSLQGTSDNMTKMLKRADLALYDAKQEGRNRVAADAA